jgi:serine/threonine protein kinase
MGFACAHANIVRLGGAFCSPAKTQLYIEMEWCAATLSMFLKDADYSVPEGKVRSIGRQLLAGLRHLHAVDVIHCDIKPDNILINAPLDDGRLAAGAVKICDFNAARHLLQPGPLPPHCEVNTPGFKPLEIVCLQPWGAGVDVWAAGVVLAALAGFRSTPFRSESLYYLEDQHGEPVAQAITAQEQIDVIHNAVGPLPAYLFGGRPPRVSKHGAVGFEAAFAYAPAGLRPVLREMLAPDPDMRITAASALADAYFM